MDCASTPKPMPPTNRYATGAEELFPDLHQAFRESLADLVYVTDRTLTHDEAGKLGYGYGRPKRRIR